MARPIAIKNREVTGRDDIQWQADDVGGTDDPEMEDLLSACAEAVHVPVKLLKQLLQTEWAGQGMSERATVLPKVEALLKKDWRPLEVKVTEAWEEARETSPQVLKQEMLPGQLTLFD